MDFEGLVCHFEVDEVVYFRPFEELVEIRNLLKRNQEEPDFTVCRTRTSKLVCSYSISFYEPEMMKVNEMGGAICRYPLHFDGQTNKLRVFFPHRGANVWFRGHSFILSPFLFVPETSLKGEDDRSIFDSSEYKSLFGKG